MAKDLTNISLNGSTSGGTKKNTNVLIPTATTVGNTLSGVLGNKYSGMPSIDSKKDAVVDAVSQYNQNTSAPYSNEYTERITQAVAEPTWEQAYNTLYPTNSGGSTPPSNNEPSGPSGGGTDYQTLLNALYAQQQANAQALNAQQQQNALDAYNRNMAAMNDAYNTRLGLLGGNFDTTMGLLDSNYAQAQAQQRQSAEDALRQAYIDRMMGEKNLTQQLVANGISGGASESARAGLINAYGNNRNSIQRSLLDNLTALDGNYLTNAHNARQAYNDALASAAAEMANYQAQFSRDLENGNATSYSDMFNHMSNLDNTYLNRMGDVLTNQQKVDLANLQKQQEAVTSDWRVGYVQDAIKNNLSKKGIVEYLTKHLMSEGYSDDEAASEVAEIMNKAGVTLD